MTTETEISAFIYLEADLLDRQKWNEWAALYTDDCVIWVPAWNTEEQLIKDPEIVRGIGSHEYDYQACTELRIFCKVL